MDPDGRESFGDVINYVDHARFAVQQEMPGYGALWVMTLTSGEQGLIWGKNKVSGMNFHDVAKVYTGADWFNQCLRDIKNYMENGVNPMYPNQPEDNKKSLKSKYAPLVAVKGDSGAAMGLITSREGDYENVHLWNSMPPETWKARYKRISEAMNFINEQEAENRRQMDLSKQKFLGGN